MKPGTTRRGVLGVIAAAVAGLFSKGVLAVCGEATQSPSAESEDTVDVEVSLDERWYSHPMRIPDDRLEEFLSLSRQMGFRELPAENMEQWLIPAPKDWSAEAMREWLQQHGACTNNRIVWQTGRYGTLELVR